VVSGQSVHFPHAQHRNLVDAQNEHQLKIDAVQNQLAKSLGHFGQLKKPDASLPKSTGQNGPLKGVKGERLAQ